MFCQYCGAKINDEALFCRKCGKSTMENNASNSNDTPMDVVPINTSNAMTSANDVYDREALKVYLGTIRSLECAKQKLTRDINNIDSNISRLGISKSVKELRTTAGWFDSDWLYILVFAAIGIIGGSIIDIPVHWISDSHIVRTIGVTIGVIIIVGLIIFLIYQYAQENQRVKIDQRRYEEECKNEAIRVKSEQDEKNRLVPIRQAMYEEYLKADELLANAYAIDIIPSQFRNLYAVESFSNALMQCDLDAIKSKLDAIIANQETIILNQAIIMAQNEELMQQNKKHMRHLASIEQNQATAIKYTQIAANNAEACARIALANYIR